MLPPLKHSRTAELLCYALPESREQISASVRINGEQIAAAIQPSLFRVASSAKTTAAALMIHAGLTKAHSSVFLLFRPQDVLHFFHHAQSLF